MKRRDFIKAPLVVAGASMLGASGFRLGKKKIRDFGKIYDYLRDGHLRAKELGRQRITVKNAKFTGSPKIQGTSWQYFDFVDCEFTGQYSISLEWLTDSTFTNCDFKGLFGLGDADDVKFVNCTAKGESILSFEARSRGLVFEQCSFVNKLRDRNHVGAIMCNGEVSFIDCTAEGFALDGYKKLTLRRCTTRSAELGTASTGLYDDISQMPYSDFLLEDCDFTRGVEMVNAKLNSLTMRNCKISIFNPFRSIVRGDVLIEGIKEGHLSLLNNDFQGKLTVRNSSFFHSYKGYCFRCLGIVATNTLIENIVCGSDPVNVSGASSSMTEEKRLPRTRNKSFVIRDCKIPRLHVDWAQTEHLRIENCQLGHLFIRNGRIGKLEIIDCSLMHLDVSDTQVQSQDVRIPEGGKISGHVTVTKGSNIKLLPR